MRILKISFYVLIFLLSIFTFMPKDSLYYMGEKILSKNDIVISNEKIIKQTFGLNITDGIVTYGNIRVVKFEKSNISILGFYNSITIESIKNMSFLESFLPTNTEKINIIYSIHNPLSVVFNAKGDFGKAKGDYSIYSGMFKIQLTPSLQMQQKYSFVLSQMKNENGVFTYEQKL